jgi:hypothetical protein
LGWRRIGVAAGSRLVALFGRLAALLGHGGALGGNIKEALSHIERSSTLSPDSVHVRRMSGWTCMIAGKHERSIEHFRRAMQLDSMEPWAYEAYWGIAYPHFFTRDRPRDDPGLAVFPVKIGGNLSECIAVERTLDARPTIHAGETIGLLLKGVG